MVLGRVRIFSKVAKSHILISPSNLSFCKRNEQKEERERERERETRGKEKDKKEKEKDGEIRIGD